MKLLKSILTVTAVLLISVILTSCNDCKKELVSLQSECDSLKHVIEEMQTNCLSMSDLKSSDCEFRDLTTESKSTAEANILNFEAFSRLKGYDIKDNSQGFFLSNANVFHLLESAMRTETEGFYFHFSSDNPSNPRYFRYYISPVSCSKNQNNEFEFKAIAGSEYKYQDIGCPKHCFKN